MNFKYVSAAVLLMLAITEPRAIADTYHTREINIGSQSVTPAQEISSTNPFHIQSESFFTECIEKCRSVRVNWVPLMPLLNKNQLGTGYIFASGISGIAVLVKPEENQNANQQRLDVGLVKIAGGHGGGELSNSPLIERHIDQLDENGEIINRIIERINIVGKVNRSGCIMPQGQNIDMKLPPVPLSQLRNLSVGQILTGVSDTSFLSFQCEAGLSGSLDLYFNSLETTPLSEVDILQGYTLSGKRSGIGFIVNAGEKKISWDGKSPLRFFLNGDTKNFIIPFKAYYTRISNDIIPGDVYARGLVTVVYH
ncbi:TPA: hypothetical protein IBX06_004641 [Escherichia coli]|nr:hypothetical protein [Escherichia coli]HAM4818463.1 hypothetical protein [Escherichia coli]HAM4823392.1 hypothetical protein [Escherichia coli]HAM4842265.1 hypothetical protein [Escherichia coli]HAM4861491.1 hypothetical protein [Escherichia coli]